MCAFCAVNRNAHRVNFTHQMNGVSWDVRLAIQTGYAIESAPVSPTALNDDRRRRDANARLGFTIHHDFGFGCTRMCNIFDFPITRRQRFMACNIVEINLLIYLRTFILYALIRMWCISNSLENCKIVTPRFIDRPMTSDNFRCAFFENPERCTESAAYFIQSKLRTSTAYSRDNPHAHKIDIKTHNLR